MFLVWFVKITAAPFLFLYFKLKLIGKKRAGKIDGKTILVANHVSTWDPVLINYIFPSKRIYFMTATELFGYSKLFSWFLRRLGAFPVNRFQSDLTAVNRANEILNEDKILGVFPEGKRSLDRELLPFKAGAVMAALNTGAPIVPIYIGGNYGFFKRQRAVVGEKIWIKDFCEEKHPSGEKLAELCRMLHDKVSKLEEECKSAA